MRFIPTFKTYESTLSLCHPEKYNLIFPPVSIIFCTFGRTDMLTWQDNLQNHELDPETKLRARNAARELRREARKRGVHAVRLLTPEQRFGEVIDALAEQRRETGVHISEIARTFTAKFPTRGHGHASLREVAAALRAKGWIRIRDWKGATTGYETRWFPPEDQ